MNKRIVEDSDPFGPFNLSDFKKWMQNQQDAKDKNLIGLEVESKIPIKKLISRIEVQNGDPEMVIKEFKKHGGRIFDVDGQDFLIETKKGTFITHKMYIKKKDE